MSFGAMAAWQAGLLLLAAGGAAAALFYLKVRPPRVAVPSLLLWRRVLDHAREMTLWERIRKAVSLAATVVIALALALALTRPGPAVTGGAARGRVLIVLDSSWSMLARTSGGETRWDRAVGLARQLAASAGGDDVAIATTADGLVEGPTQDLALIESALGQASPAGGEEAAWPRIGGAAEVHFITDGSVDRPLEPDVIIHSVYEAAPNVAITAFGVRRPAMPSSRGEAYLEVANYAGDPQTVRVVVTRGTEVLADAQVEMEAGEAVRQTLPLDAGGPRLRARVSAPANALALDDEAVAWVEGAEPLSVVVVSADPGALGLVLERHPGVQATFVAPGRYDPDAAADVIVFDRWLPPAPPGRPALMFSPPDSSWLGERRTEEPDAQWISRVPHPVVAGVDPQTLNIVRAVGYHGETLESIAQSTRGTPLVSIADQSDRRFVVLGVALADSNLAFSPAFPVFVGNALEWLARPVLDTVDRPGVVALPSSTTRVTSPAGSPVPLLDAGEQMVARLRDPGLYLVEAGGARSVIGVNVGGPDVSNLTRTALSESVLAAGQGDGASRRVWWLWAVAAAFLLLAVEWWTWQRRITV